MLTIDELKKIDKELSQEIFDFANANNILNEDAWPIYDGLYSAELYWNSPLRIMWILKEPYDDFDKETGKPIGGDWSITKDLFNSPYKFGTNKTGEMVIYSTYGIINNKKWADMDYLYDDDSIPRVLQKIAYINLSKMPAYSTSKDGNLWKKYSQWREISLKQIKMYEPNVLIFGNTFKYFQDDLNDLYQISNYDSKKTKMLDVYKNSERILVDAWHPGNRFSNQDKEEYVNSLVFAINNWYEEISEFTSSTEEKFKLITKVASFLVENRLKMKGADLVSFLNTNNYQTSYGTSYQGGRGIYKLIRDCWHFYSSKNDYKMTSIIEKAFVNNQGYPAFW